MGDYKILVLVFTSLTLSAAWGYEASLCYDCTDNPGWDNYDPHCGDYDYHCGPLALSLGNYWDNMLRLY